MVRRRRGFVIPGANIPGTIEGNKYRLNREPDEFFINDRRARGGNIGVAGSTTHLHVHTGRRRRGTPKIQQIDFEGERRRIQAMIQAKQMEVKALIKMPAKTPEEVEAKTLDFAKKTHPIRATFGFWDNSKKKFVRKTFLQTWNPLGFRTAWFWHPIRTANKLLPVQVGMGIGRKTKRAQARAYRTNLEETSTAYREIDLANRANQLLADYSKILDDGLTEYQRTGNRTNFERSIKDAEALYRKEMWTVNKEGMSGIMTGYIEKRKPH